MHLYSQKKDLPKSLLMNKDSERFISIIFLQLLLGQNQTQVILISTVSLAYPNAYIFNYGERSMELSYHTVFYFTLQQLVDPNFQKRNAIVHIRNAGAAIAKINSTTQNE